MKKLTLSFDNGPTPGVTEFVLDMLDLYGIKTTFFVIGRKAACAEGQEILREIAGRGHWVANHSYSHSVALGECPDPDYAAREIERTQRLIEHVAHPAKYFRPYGNAGILGPHLLSASALSLLTEGRYTCVLWNSIPGDWKDPAGWVDRGLAQARDQDWAVPVIHDIDNGALPRLDAYLDGILALGIDIVQHFPDAAILIERGVPRQPLDDYLTR